jgi:hypothetical protein
LRVGVAAVFCVEVIGDQVEFLDRIQGNRAKTAEPVVLTSVAVAPSSVLLFPAPAIGVVAAETRDGLSGVTGKIPGAVAEECRYLLKASP